MIQVSLKAQSPLVGDGTTVVSRGLKPARRDPKAILQYSNQHVFPLKGPPLPHLENTEHYLLSAHHKTHSDALLHGLILCAVGSHRAPWSRGGRRWRGVHSKQAEEESHDPAYHTFASFPFLPNLPFLINYLTILSVEFNKSFSIGKKQFRLRRVFGLLQIIVK